RSPCFAGCRGRGVRSPPGGCGALERARRRFDCARATGRLKVLPHFEGMRLTRSLPGIAACAALLFAGATATFAQEGNWRRVEPENLVVLTLPDGEVLIELAPAFAPRTVAQFKELVANGFYDGLEFYRVIDGFVAQGGDGSDMAGTAPAVPLLPPQFARACAAELLFLSVQRLDMFAPETGFIDGFAAARDPEAGRVWLTHCPGIVAMARNNEPDTGSTDFYIVIGQAPRYLDRNLTIFGRVIDGMEVVQRIHR